MGNRHATYLLPPMCLHLFKTVGTATLALPLYQTYHVSDKVVHHAL